jgi:hypothetical protein
MGQKKLGEKGRRSHSVDEEGKVVKHEYNA